MADPESSPARATPAAPVREAAVEIVGLRREFGERTALAGIDATLPRGETLSVLGPNGSGKSTLLRILAGLLRPSAGSARVLGCALPGEIWRVRGRIGYVGHLPLLYRDLTARENLRFSARLHGLDPARADAGAAKLLARVEMEGRADEQVASLSAGMVRRIDICRALIHEPVLLLLDEPDTNLDAAARELVDPLIGPDCGATRVIVGHDRERALRGAHAVLEMG